MKSTLQIAVVAVAISLSSCSSSKPANDGGNAKPQQPILEVTEVVANPIETTVLLPGELQPYESVAILPKVTGFVEWIGVDRGSHVKTGQLLCRLDAPAVNSQRAEANAKLDSAKSQLASVEA